MAIPSQPLVRRVRAILLTERATLLFILRQKAQGPPHWMAPGGGLDEGETYPQALQRELREELGATVEIMERAFILRHQKAGKNLEEHFYICRLLEYDLALRDGPEFADPSRGSYDPCEVPLTAEAIAPLRMKTDELRAWLLEHLPYLRHCASAGLPLNEQAIRGATPG